MRDFRGRLFCGRARIFCISRRSLSAGVHCWSRRLIFAGPWRVERLMAFLDPCAQENAARRGLSGLSVALCASVRAASSAKVLPKVSRSFFICRIRIRILFSRSSAKNSGLIGTLAVVVAFGLLLWRGTRAALMAPDRFGMLLGIGIITGLIVQALFNISVVISILPAKGIPLPFISYGGSSILVTLFAVGILLNISQYAGFVSLLKIDGK